MANIYTIGIDIGGTKIKFGMFDELSKIIKIEEIKTPTEVVINTIIDKIKSLIQDEKLIGIGIATAGIVDFDKGLITHAANIPQFINIPLKNILERTFRVPVRIANDVNSAALAEGNIGIARTIRNYIFVAIGTGIGGGIIHNNKLVHGLQGYGGEIGHMTIWPNGLECGCGRKGCWETYASGRALERMITEYPDLVLKNFRPKDLFDQFSMNESCKKIIYRFIEYLSIGIINLQYIFDPEMIIIGGGVINSSERWWNILLQHITDMSKISLNIQKPNLKNNASMIGANYLINNEV